MKCPSKLNNIHFFKIFFCCFERDKKEKHNGQTRRSSILWFIPQRPAIVGAESDWSQMPRLGVSHPAGRNPRLCAITCDFPGCALTGTLNPMSSRSSCSGTPTGIQASEFCQVSTLCPTSSISLSSMVVLVHVIFC